MSRDGPRRAELVPTRAVGAEQLDVAEAGVAQEAHDLPVV
jgi:hypothetical protein